MDRLSSFLHSHPKLSLYLLTPGIIEYLSGSSPVYYLLLNPIIFALQLAVVASLYLPGALLIREAMIRWRKGWGSVLLMGAAYGILEEGPAVDTLFNPKSSPAVSNGLGSYGHWLGVSWVWGAWVIPLHMVFSIALPIFLLGLALPETQGKRLLASRRSLAGAISVLGLGVLVNVLIGLHVSHVWTGAPLFVLSLAVVGALVLAARVAPAGIIHAQSDTPRISYSMAGVLGGLFYISIQVEATGGASAGLPAEATFALLVATLVFFLVLVLRTMGHRSNERQLIAFSLGLVLPVLVEGLVSQIFLPLVAVADVFALLFFRRVWRKHSGGEGIFSSAMGVTQVGTAAGSERRQLGHAPDSTSLTPCAYCRSEL